MRRAFVNLFTCHHPQTDELSFPIWVNLTYSFFLLTFLHLYHKDLKNMLILRGLMPLILYGVLLLELKIFLSLHMPKKGAHILTPHWRWNRFKLWYCRSLCFVGQFGRPMCPISYTIIHHLKWCMMILHATPRPLGAILKLMQVPSMSRLILIIL